MSAMGEPMPELEKQRWLETVAQHGRALQYAAAELKADREVVLAAVAQDGRALPDAAAELKADREVVLAAEAQHGFALQYAAAELKADREVVLAAVAQHGCALVHAAAELKADREVALAAGAQDGRALPYAAAELRTDALLLKMRSLNPRLSAILLMAQLRLCVAYACHERVGSESLLGRLPLEVIELIDEQTTVLVALHGLVCRPALLSEGVPPE